MSRMEVKNMKDWKKLASDNSISKTVLALQANGIQAIVVDNKQQAKEKISELLPKGAEVMPMTSVTLDTIGISKEINESGNYNSVRQKLMTMDRKTQSLEMQKLGASPEWTIGSVQAVTEDGHILIASNTGSQLSAYVYGSPHVVWVVGSQKIVTNTDEGIKRIYEHVLPLESERVKKAYGMERSNVSKLLIINKEIKPNRITVIFVKESLGF